MGYSVTWRLKMTLKLFKLKKFITPEWGPTYDVTTRFYISHDVQDVIEQIEGYALSGSDGKWTYEQYSSMDREELNVILEEVEYTFV
jgi:hypothetical protein